MFVKVLGYQTIDFHSESTQNNFCAFCTYFSHIKYFIFIFINFFNATRLISDGILYTTFMALAHIQGHRVVWFLYIYISCLMLVRFYVLFILVCGGKKGRESITLRLQELGSSA